jgi:putative ABC transport system ATP-binding protein
MAKQIVIKVQKVSRIYDLGKAQVKAVTDISFDIYSGEYIILFGPSGCGKSTLLNMISGMETPNKGKIMVRNEDISKFDRTSLARYRRTKIGLVFQQYNLIRSMNTTDNVAFPLLANGISKRIRMRRARNLLEKFGLSKRENNIPTELSGGEQQRVAICRALSNNPWILITDEPTGSIDSKSADKIMDIFFRQNRHSKRTVLLVTHNPDYLKYAHRIIYMKDGKIVNIQVNEDIKRKQTEDEVVLLEDLPHIGEELTKRLEKKGYHDIEDIAKVEPKTLSKVRGISEEGAAEIIEAARKQVDRNKMHEEQSLKKQEETKHENH